MSETATEPREAWLRLEKETDAQWRAFCIYRDAGGARSIRLAWKEYRATTGKKPVTVPRWFTDWTQANNWTLRTRAYDSAELERIRIENEGKRNAARQVLLDGAETIAKSMVVLGRGKRLPGMEINEQTARAAQRDILNMAGVSEARRLEVSGPGGGPITMRSLDAIDELTDEEITKMFEDLAGVNE